MSYYQRILRGAQSQFAGTIAARDAVDWNAVMDSLMTTGTALAGGATLTLANGNVTTVAFNPAALGGGNTLKGSFAADALALADDDPVSTWADASGEGNDATQAGSVRPTFKTNVQNSRPGVLFASASFQYMLANGLASVQNGDDLPATVIVVQRHVTVAAAEQAYFSWSQVASGTPFHQIAATTGPAVQLDRRDDAGTRKSTTGGTYNTSAHVISGVFTGTLGSTWQDGVSLASDQDMDVTALTIDRFTLGARGIATSFYDGYLFEVLIYSAALSDSDRQAAERSLGSKWGITVA